ncbi:MAG: class I tRNA ligase family protein, partial [Cellulomonas sp.]
PSQIIDHFGSDAFRYYFLRAIPFGQDGSFSWEDLSARYNAELANGFGNLASRVAAMVAKYFGGALPAAGEPGPAEVALAGVAAKAVVDAEDAIDRLALHEVIGAVWTIVEATNGYITEQAPWKVAKDPAEREPAATTVDDPATLPDDDAPFRQGGRLATILATSAEALRALAVLLNPVTPKAAAGLWTLLGAQEPLGDLDAQPVARAAVFGQLPPGTPITKGSSLFPRREDPQDPLS